MPVVVERSFKTASDIVAGTVSRRLHRLGRSQAPASRTANEEKVVVLFDAKRLELTAQTLGKARVHGLIGKGLPLHEDSPFAGRPEVRNPHIGPFRPRAHIDKLRARMRLEGRPDRLHVNIIDRSIAGLCAQRKLPPFKTKVRCKNKFGADHNRWWLHGKYEHYHPQLTH